MRTNYIKSTTHNENSLDYRHGLQKCRGRSRIKFLSISCCLKTSPLVESVGQAGHQGDGEGDGLGCNPVKPHLGIRFIKKEKYSVQISPHFCSPLLQSAQRRERTPGRRHRRRRRRARRRWRRRRRRSTCARWAEGSSRLPRRGSWPPPARQGFLRLASR